MTDIPERRRRMAASACKDLFGDFRNSEGTGQMPTVMSDERLADLLKENFGKDVEILAQFLKYSHLTIEQLQEWRKLADS